MDTESGHNMPDGGDQPVNLSLFDRMNNYVLLLYAVSCFLIYASLSVLLYLRGPAYLSLSLPGIFGIMLPLYMLCRRFDLRFAREFSISRPETVETAIVLLIAFAAILPADAITWVFERNTPVDDDYISFLLAIKPKGVASFALIAAGIGLLSPLAEELLFRGYIQRIFHRNMDAWAAIGLGALVFAASHSNVRLIPGVGALGLALGYVFYRTGNLIYPFMAHMVFNMVSLSRLAATPAEAIRETESSGPSASWLVISVIALAAGIYLLERRAPGREKTGDTPPGAPPV